MRLSMAMVVALWVSVATEARAGVIVAAERLDGGGPSPALRHAPAPTFSPHTQIWIDYTFVWGATPAYLRGADQVLTRLSPDTADPAYRLRLTLSRDAFVYLLIDDRAPAVAAHMPWVAQLGFADTGDEAEMDLAGRFVNASVYRATVPAGDLVLLQQNTHPNVAFMYTVAATPVPEPGAVGLGAVAGIWVLSRRRR
jgi:MYXO-CTERM domain-containing protein